MNSSNRLKPIAFTASLALALALPAHAALVQNGSFESGLSGWTTIDQTGSDGAFFLQSGTLSPVNGETVQPPPDGLQAAMTDSGGPGSHVLYQDFVVPTGITEAKLRFSLYINTAGADDFHSPGTLDFATGALNQQARVDLLTDSADVFSLASSDILQSFYGSLPGDPRVSGYTSYEFDIASLLQAKVGQTLRLRFAEVDNVAPFIFGVDGVSLDISSVPDGGPAPIMLFLGVLVIGGIARSSRLSVFRLG